MQLWVPLIKEYLKIRNDSQQKLQKGRSVPKLKFRANVRILSREINSN